MKIRLLLILGLGACLQAKAQSLRLTDSILNNKLLRIPAYQLPGADASHILLKMAFGKSEWTDTAGISLLNDANILSEDLVFTDYPANLDLKPLNRKRFLALFTLLPVLQSQPEVVYSVVRQMNGNTKPRADSMLHGFVINYRPAVRSSLLETEIDLVTRIIPPPPPPPAVPAKDSVITGTSKTTKRRSHWDYKYKRPFMPDLVDSTVKFKPLPYTPAKLRDSTVLKVFDRNSFNKMLVVADVTQSMAMYSSQVLYWLSKQKEAGRLAWMVCFNDGNNANDGSKIPGNTGGIYGLPATDMEETTNLIRNTMRAGLGGDTPENNCEAIIKAIDMATGYEDIVVIADAWAGIRDIELVGKILKPVKVIVCGGNLGLHPDHITVALRSGGSLHFINEDISDFSALQKRKTMIIRGREYRFDGRKVKLVVK